MRQSLPLLLVLGWLAFGVPAGLAQLSPGKLARPHSALEGLTKCTQCHELGKAVSDDRCLVCHTEIKGRLAAPRSVHSRKELAGRTCASCHSDHHGPDYSMIHWEGGEKAFDHGRTGFLLQEAHKGLECRDCHKPAFMEKGSAPRFPNLNPKRSYLGLKGDCQACHQDPHKSSLGDRCTTCHGVRTWDQLPGFDHNRSWPLEGAHRKVECRECHSFPAGLKDTERTEGARIFKSLAHDRCVDCHKDPHDNRFGTDCLSCHTLDSFRGAGEGFDHTKTRWPLTGAHTKVSCTQCHGQKREKMRMAFAACDDCHKDPHAGQFRTPADKAARCETCHRDTAWKPARFGFLDHGRSAFPLEGAHGAVPCGLCHKAATGSTAVRWRGLPSGCVDCHQSPHEPREATETCRDCHGQDSWRVETFDHGTSEFPLRGAHARVTCTACHAGSSPPERPLSGLKTTCAGCHEDRHDGQFADGASRGACEACHNEEAFRPSTFDHQTQSRYVLDGAHRDVDCVLCHETRRRANGERDRVYRPLGMTCADCHGGGAPAEPRPAANPAPKEGVEP